MIMQKIACSESRKYFYFLHYRSVLQNYFFIAQYGVLLYLESKYSFEIEHLLSTENQRINCFEH